MNYGPASKYYDLFSSNSGIDFYKELGVKKGRKALELGVGTGRVATELAKASVNVLGIDNSPYMLNVAREKLRKENLAVKKRVALELGGTCEASKQRRPFHSSIFPLRRLSIARQRKIRENV